MALPLTGITTSMVASAIGAATNDVGRLCTHPNVNKWSRWKPISLAKITGITESDLSSVNFGFTPKSFYVSEIPSNKQNETSLFVWGDYEKPTGGATSPYRLGDFRNYNHQALSPFVGLELKNSNNYQKPVSGNYTYPQYIPTYRCRLIFEPNADIRLHEFHVDTLNLADLKLTLIIGGNFNGLSAPEFLYAQSSKTLGAAINDGNLSLLVELNTFDLAETIQVNQNIVLACLAPIVSSKSELFGTKCVSLKFNPLFNAVLYFDNYAIYGDGSSDGGSIPVSTAYGTWEWLNDVNPYIALEYGEYIMHFDMLSYIMQTGASGFANLVVFIQELNQEFVITQSDKIDLSAIGSRIIDTTLEKVNLGNLYNSFTGNTFTQLTCKFYVRSASSGITVSFNEQNITIDVPQY